MFSFDEKYPIILRGDDLFVSPFVGWIQATKCLFTHWRRRVHLAPHTGTSFHYSRQTLGQKGHFELFDLQKI